MNRLKTLFIASFCAFACLGFSSILIGEPWLSTRFAQNCSGCHAPQRVNVKPVSRRCSLSCQGCHVNPNGGGLRSYYGKWNENRWLRSFRSDFLKHSKNVAAYPDQNYGQNKFREVVKKLSKKQQQSIREKGLNLVETTSEMDESEYSRKHGNEKVIAQSQTEFLYQIPNLDPWRIKFNSKVDGGGDFRWYSASSTFKNDGSSSSNWFSFLMAADLGIRYRPVYKKLNFVYESRFFGSHAKHNKYSNTFGGASTRSLYMMVDDLPYNVFVQGGYYRPLFGNLSPDHDHLAQQMISFAMSGRFRSQSLVMEAVSAGTAPNVPYLNLHKIGKLLDTPEDRTDGFALNTGMRFVTLGASVNLSYWSTKQKGSEKPNLLEMVSIGGALKLGRAVLSYEGLSIIKDDQNTQRDLRQGGVHSLDAHIRLWKEVYWQSNIAASNASRELTPGSAQQLKTGIRGFMIPGIECGVFYENTKESQKLQSTTISRDTQRISSQLHAYF